MIDVETLSNRILDDDFEQELVYSEFIDEDDSLTHYGVKGMKWGVRKDRTSVFTKKRDRRYADETDKEYQARMNREFQERTAKARAKEQAAAEKRASKERLQLQKMLLKSQERQQKMQIKSKEKDRAEQVKKQEAEAKRKAEELKKAAKEAAKKSSRHEIRNVRNLSDMEINEAIARFKLEQEYKKQQKAARSATAGMFSKTLSGTGDIVMSVGKEVVKSQLKDVATDKVDDLLIKKGLKKKKSDKGLSKDDVNKLIEDFLKKGGLI